MPIFNGGFVKPIAHHDDVIKWKHFPRNWPFVREIHRSPVNFPHKGQWRGALMFSLIYAWINDWVNNREAGDLRRQHGHYDVIVMQGMDEVSHPTYIETKTSQIVRFMGPTWGTPGSCRPHMGPMLAPWTLLSGILAAIVRLDMGKPASLTEIRKVIN